MIDAKIAVYTCILPWNYTPLCTPYYVNPDKDQVHYWAILDQPVGVDPWWEMIITRDPNLSSRRDLQKYKMQSHVLLPEYSWTVWVDGCIGLLVDPMEIVEEVKESGKKVAFGIHPFRDCSYEEGKACAGFRSNSGDIINTQLARYHEAGFPEHNGLIASTFFVRDNRDPSVCAFFDLWLKETMGGSHRNQISYGYSAWKSGIDPLIWNMPWGNNRFWKWNPRDGSNR